MKLPAKISEHPVFKLLTNRYVLILIVFGIWMLFFDENSLLTHLKFDKEIEKLENSIEFYQKEIQQNKTTIDALGDPEKLEKFAREFYKMKKEEETLFLINFDTLQ